MNGVDAVPVSWTAVAEDDGYRSSGVRGIELY
jgi:hypothetical protein